MLLSIVPLAAAAVLCCSPMLLAAAYCRRDLRYLLPLPAMVSVLLLYPAFIAGYPVAGAWVIAAGDLLMLLAALPGICRDFRGVCRRFFTPAQVIFLLWLVIFFCFNRGRLFYHWDEFSHWGLAVRTMADTSLLPCFSAETLHFASYPPGMPLWQWLICTISGGYTEEIPVFATAALLFSLLAVGAAGFTWRDRGQIVLYALTGWLFPVAFQAFFYSVYVDGPLAMTMGYALALIALKDRAGSPFVRWSALIVSGVFLVLVKASGSGLAVMIWLTALAEVLFRREPWRERLRYEWAGLLLYPAALVLVSRSWQYLLEVCRTPAAFSGAAINARSLFRAVFLNEPAHSHGVIAAWGRKFLPGLSIGGELWSYTPGVLAVTVFLVVVFLRLGRQVPEDASQRKRLLIMAFAAPAATAVFAVTMLVWYIFSFTLHEALSAASFDRYVNTVLLAFYFTALILAGVLRRRSAAAFKPDFLRLLIPLMLFLMIPFFRISGDLPKVLLTAVIYTVSAAGMLYYYLRSGSGGRLRKELFALLVLLPLLRIPWIALNTYTITNGFNYWKREKLSPVAVALKEELRAGKNRVMVIHQGGTGEYYHMMRLLAYPAVMKSPWSFRLPESEPDRWSAPATPGELLELMPADGYVYCHYVDEKFRRDYGMLFSDPVISGGIYAVGRDGKLRLAAGNILSGPARQ